MHIDDYGALLKATSKEGDKDHENQTNQVLHLVHTAVAGKPREQGGLAFNLIPYGNPNEKPEDQLPPLLYVADVWEGDPKDKSLSSLDEQKYAFGLFREFYSLPKHTGALFSDIKILPSAAWSIIALPLGYSRFSTEKLLEDYPDLIGQHSLKELSKGCEKMDLLPAKEITEALLKLLTASYMHHLEIQHKDKWFKSSLKHRLLSWQLQQLLKKQDKTMNKATELGKKLGKHEDYLLSTARSIVLAEIENRINNPERSN